MSKKIALAMHLHKYLRMKTWHRNNPAEPRFRDLRGAFKRLFGEEKTAQNLSPDTLPAYAHALYAILDALPPKTRMVFLDHRMDGASFEQIGLRHDMSPQTVEFHLRQVLAHCRQGMIGLPSSSENQVEREADRWFFRLRGDVGNVEDQAAFHRWLDQAPSHAVAYEQAEELFTACGDAAHLLYLRAHPAPTRPGLRQLLPWIAGAASVLSLAIFIGTSTIPDQWLSESATYVGERREMFLDDGTVIEMDTDTALDLRSDDDQRGLYLRHGRIYVDVAQDPNHPFLVQTRHGEAKSVDARFSISARENATTVTVEDGNVGFRSLNSNQPPQRITSGQRASSDGRYLSIPVKIDPDIEFSWRNGLIVVEDQPLSAVITRLNRYWPGQVILMDSHMAKRKVTAVFEVDRRDDSLNMLYVLLGIRTIQITPYLTLLY